MSLKTRFEKVLDSLSPLQAYQQNPPSPIAYQQNPPIPPPSGSRFIQNRATKPTGLPTAIDKMSA
ncbi:MAG: hypothetical protein RLP02_31890 [Coleofasciculus sp. C2-GNP5-27]